MTEEDKKELSDFLDASKAISAYLNHQLEVGGIREEVYFQKIRRFDKSLELFENFLNSHELTP